MTGRSASPWLRSPTFDSCFIVLPAFASVALAIGLHRFSGGAGEVTPWAWLIFIVGIDVAHVYGTLFRTYLVPDEIRDHRALLTLIPVGAWLIGVFLYHADALYFWRALTYAALFHFVRQQYGFTRLYARGEDERPLDRGLLAAVIYLATLYPIVYWHAHQPRHFQWFIEDEFVIGLPPLVATLIGWIYIGVLTAHVVNEARRVRRGAPFNVPKNAIVAGTALSWYVGIVHFDGDLVFTVTNVVTHGIPYMALVWLYGCRRSESAAPSAPRRPIDYRLFFRRHSGPLFVGALLAFAFVEEGLWAGLVWREHLDVFGPLRQLPRITSHDTLTWLVPLLALPQATHYLLDGFVWKVRTPGASWARRTLDPAVRDV